LDRSVILFDRLEAHRTILFDRREAHRTVWLDRLKARRTDTIDSFHVKRIFIRGLPVSRETPRFAHQNFFGNPRFT
jgi:hypothetical protein